MDRKNNQVLGIGCPTIQHLAVAFGFIGWRAAVKVIH